MVYKAVKTQIYSSTFLKVKFAFILCIIALLKEEKTFKVLSLFSSS